MKSVITTLEEVAEPLRTEYEARDGKFHLKIEGDIPAVVAANTKLAEFRDNNRTLNSKVTELEGNIAKFKDIDPAKYAEMTTKLADFENKGIKPGTDLTKMISDAIASATGPLEKKLADREASEKAAQEALARSTVENQLREAGMKVGVEEKAITDFIRRGTEVFKPVDGKPAPRKADGSPIFSKKNVTEELSMEEWATELQGEAPFLFKPSRGGGAGGSGNGGGGGGPKRTIQADPMEFGKNLEDIAKGNVQVNI